MNPTGLLSMLNTTTGNKNAEEGSNNKKRPQQEGSPATYRDQSNWIAFDADEYYWEQR